MIFWYYAILKFSKKFELLTRHLKYLKKYYKMFFLQAQQWLRNKISDAPVYGIPVF